jgi:hypothetical protein
MKQIKVVGLCLVVAFALSALISTTAQAATPEFGNCVAAKKGFYKDSKCTERDEKKGAPKGKFEWQAGAQPTCVAVKKGFYKDSGCTERDEKKGAPKGKFEKECEASCADIKSKSGAATFYTFEPLNESEPSKLPQGATLTGLGGVVKCTSSSGSGEITGASESEEQITFSGCQSLSTPCESIGSAAGTIVASRVVGELELLPAGKGVGMIARIPGSGEIEIECGSVRNEFSGEALGVVTGDISSPSTTSAETWAVTNPSEGVQKERYFLNGANEEVGGPQLCWQSDIEHYEASKFGKFGCTGFEADEEISQASMEVRP